MVWLNLLVLVMQSKFNSGSVRCDCLAKPIWQVSLLTAASCSLVVALTG